MANTLNIAGFETVPAPASMSGKIADTVDNARSTFAQSVAAQAESDRLLVAACGHIQPLADILDLCKESKAMTQEQCVRVYFGGDEPADIAKSVCGQWANAAYAVRDLNPPKRVLDSGLQALSEYRRHMADVAKIAKAAQSDLGNGSGSVAKANAAEVVADLEARVHDWIVSAEEGGNVAMIVSDSILAVGADYAESIDGEAALDAAGPLASKNANLAKRVRKNAAPKDSKGSGKSSGSGTADLNDQSVVAYIDSRIQTEEGRAKFYAEILRTLGRNGAAQFYANGDASLNG